MLALYASYTHIFLSPTVSSLCYSPGYSDIQNLRKCQYTDCCALKLDYDEILCNLNVNVLPYSNKHHFKVSLSCSQTAQLLFKIRCSVHSVRDKSEVNSYTNKSLFLCSLFNCSVVRWIRSDTFKGCLSLIFTCCRYLYGKRRVNSF